MADYTFTPSDTGQITPQLVDLATTCKKPVAFRIELQAQNCPVVTPHLTPQILTIGSALREF